MKSSIPSINHIYKYLKANQTTHKKYTSWGGKWKEATIIKPYYKGGIPGQVKFQPHRGGAGNGNAGQTEDRHQGHLPLMAGHCWRQIWLIHLWGFPVGRDPQCSHQQSSIHTACGEIQDPGEWSREGESLETEESNTMWNIVLIKHEASKMHRLTS